MKKVSVIIPVYNAELFLSETIQSVLNQTYANIELILVNDGSTDSSLQIIKGFLPNQKITLIEQKNSGVSNARNNGYKNSTGDFLAFLDADDTWLPKKMELSINYLNSNPDVGMVHSDMQIIDEFSETKNIILKGNEGNILDDILLWEKCNVPSPSSILIRRETFKTAGEFDPLLSTAADQDFFLRVAKKYKVGRIPQILGYYREHNNNMHKNIGVMEKDHIYVYKKAEQNNYFKSLFFKHLCYSNLYLILAGSWWKDGNNKIRGLSFLLKSFIIYPPNFYKILSKVF